MTCAMNCEADQKECSEVVVRRIVPRTVRTVQKDKSFARNCFRVVGIISGVSLALAVILLLVSLISTRVMRERNGTFHPPLSLWAAPSHDPQELAAHEYSTTEPDVEATTYENIRHLTTSIDELKEMSEHVTTDATSTNSSQPPNETLDMKELTTAKLDQKIQKITKLFRKTNQKLRHEEDPSTNHSVSTPLDFCLAGHCTSCKLSRMLRPLTHLLFDEFGDARDGPSVVAHPLFNPRFLSILKSRLSLRHHRSHCTCQCFHGPHFPRDNLAPDNWVPDNWVPSRWSHPDLDHLADRPEPVFSPEPRFGRPPPPLFALPRHFHVEGGGVLLPHDTQEADAFSLLRRRRRAALSKRDDDDSDDQTSGQIFEREDSENDTPFLPRERRNPEDAESATPESEDTLNEDSRRRRRAALGQTEEAEGSEIAGREDEGSDEDGDSTRHVYRRAPVAEGGAFEQAQLGSEQAQLGSEQMALRSEQARSDADSPGHKSSLRIYVQSVPKSKSDVEVEERAVAEPATAAAKEDLPREDPLSHEHCHHKRMETYMLLMLIITLLLLISMCVFCVMFCCVPICRGDNNCEQTAGKDTGGHMGDVGPFPPVPGAGHPPLMTAGADIAEGSLTSCSTCDGKIAKHPVGLHFRNEVGEASEVEDSSESEEEEEEEAAVANEGKNKKK